MEENGQGNTSICECVSQFLRPTIDIHSKLITCSRGTGEASRPADGRSHSVSEEARSRGQTGHFMSAGDIKCHDLEDQLRYTTTY